MAILNFPASPAVDQTYIVNNVIYIWNGEYWEANSTNGFDSRYVEVDGDNMTGDLTLGTDTNNITLDAEDGDIDTKGAISSSPDGRVTTGTTLYPDGRCVINSNLLKTQNRSALLRIRDKNKDEVASIANNGDIQSLSQNGGQLAGFRNQIINGDFRVWQRGTSFTSTRDTYTADRWFANTPDLSTVDVTRLTGTPEGFYYSLRTSTDTTSLKQGIELATQNENNQFYIGSVWTFSFWTLGTPGNARLRFRRTVGSASGSVDATDTVAMSEIETSGTWKRYSATLTITGDATASSGITVLEVSVNATNGGGAVAYTGVQLEPGPVATPFEHRPIGTELALCQRYFQDLGVVYLPGVATKQTRIEQPLRPSMRADPTATYTGDNGDLISSAFRKGSMQITYIPQNTASNIFSRSIILDAEL